MALMSWIHRAPRLRVGRPLLFLLFCLLAVQLSLNLLPDPTLLLDLCACSWQYLMQGKVWTILSYALLHHPSDWSHFLLNSVGLLFFFGRIAHIFSPLMAYRILLSGILAGAGLHLLSGLLVPALDAPLIGLSGGLFALLAAYCTFSPTSILWPLRLSAKNALLGTALFSSACLLYILLQAFAPLPTPPELLVGMGHACHLGGLIAGALIAKWMIRIPQGLKKDRPKTRIV